ncbi:hypothetical protein [Streptosporangium sp. NPDC023615]|uniref:hypothetical protein n=1 Tax=Streptosporangium sp. NPDC023615 TaxID=3154794 RepID=UPI0034172A9B
MITKPMSGSVAGRPSAVADRIGRTLMAVNAVATLVAFVNGILVMNSAADDRVVTEA